MNMNTIAEYVSQFNVPVTEAQLGQFQAYMKFLQETNKFINLTAISDDEGIIEKHFIDSVSILHIVSREILSSDISMIDIGAGAGFPGLPLKLLFPQIKLTLNDSVQKKVKFLSEVSTLLGLKDTICNALRAEIIGHDPSMRESFDVAVARAVSETRVLVEYLLPLVKVGGMAVLYKSAGCEEEVSLAASAIKKLGGEIADVKNFAVGEKGRSLILIKKVKPTPNEYPRREGTPSKKPL